mgnify:CR=1 FL=1
MERYTMDIKNETESMSVVQGKYYNKIYKMHMDTYGEEGASNIRDNIMLTYTESVKQSNNVSQNNNVLIIGKVQSGKTSNLEMFSALALDNGFNMVIIYGGYDGTLLNQTTTRFRNTFEIPYETNYSDPVPVIFSSDDSAQLLSVDDEIIEDLLETNKPIFIISMKRPAAMNKVNELLNRISKSKIKAFIIDDEGDQASLNTKKNKAIDVSATYAAIVAMKDYLDDPLYLSVTATPQALVFLDEYSRLRPDSIRLIEPGKGYCGAEAYHLFDSNRIEIIEDEDQQDLTDGVMADSLRLAIQHYIIASAIMHKRGILTSDMIIHTHRNVSDHDTIYRMVDAYIQSMRDAIEFEDEDTLNLRKQEFLNSYVNLFSEDVIKEYNFEELWELICKKILTRVYIILKNSTGQVTQANEGLRKHKIYIGGDLLQRGVTFSKLVTTYFTRWAKDSGNMDTNLQRARWFGYREKYIDLCKIFTSSTISREFTTLAEIDTDLWEQFVAIQNGEMEIDEILLRADNTKQKPTRRSVANYSAVSFKNTWIKQRVGIFDKNQVRENNQLVENLLDSFAMRGTCAGRTDDGISGKYTIVDRNDLSTLIEHMQAVFDLEPFERRPLIDLIESCGDIPVIVMNTPDEKGRKRSFYPNNKIFALQQGADKKDISKATYLGDSHVIVDKNSINIQIHKIVPKKKDSTGAEREYEEYTQYMFAIYVPKEKQYFVRGE